jgi:hypothetical protein
LAAAYLGRGQGLGPVGFDGHGLQGAAGKIRPAIAKATLKIIGDIECRRCVGPLCQLTARLLIAALGFVSLPAEPAEAIAIRWGSRKAGASVAWWPGPSRPTSIAASAISTGISRKPELPLPPG